MTRCEVKLSINYYIWPSGTLYLSPEESGTW